MATSNSLTPSVFLTALLAATSLVTTARADSIEEKAAVCSACHGEQGVPIDKVTPIIWGQMEGYIYLQLRDFKSGARKNDTMQPVVADLTKDDMMALAAYFAAKPWPDLQQPSAPKDVATAAIGLNQSVGCTGCHLGEYQGDSTVPRLAGQQREYMDKTIKDFRDRSRGNNPGMSDLMNASPVDGLKAMSEYLAGMQILGGTGHGSR
ncbi:MAG: cytochrome c4 [Hyphomicrobiaceae bacterium]